MKAMFTAAALSLAASIPAWGQAVPTFGGGQVNDTSKGSTLSSIAKDPFFKRTSATPDRPDRSQVQQGGTPDLTDPSELKDPTIPLPNEPVEPYLLTKDVGPFMVMARVFRGPQAEQMALALVKELREEYGLPAYILRTKDYPGKSMIRGTPPTAGSEVMRASTRMPEKIRTLDEAAVLVGNEKTQQAQIALLRKVQKIDPKCLKGMSSPFWWRKGLITAYRTTNPYVAAQNLYPRTHDKLIVQMNKGLRNIGNCPGRFSLQVAEFSGRMQYQFDGMVNQPPALSLHSSPLRTAAADAERLADKLAKQPEFRRLGQPVYVYHDRTASRVFVGSFNSPTDPAAGRMREELLKLAVPMLRSDKNKNGLDTMIVPAVALTDLETIKAGIRE